MPEMLRVGSYEYLVRFTINKENTFSTIAYDLKISHDMLLALEEGSTVTVRLQPISDKNRIEELTKKISIN
jgi:hypothetical protein